MNLRTLEVLGDFGTKQNNFAVREHGSMGYNTSGHRVSSISRPIGSIFVTLHSRRETVFDKQIISKLRQWNHSISFHSCIDIDSVPTTQWDRSPDSQEQAS